MIYDKKKKKQKSFSFEELETGIILRFFRKWLKLLNIKIVGIYFSVRLILCPICRSDYPCTKPGNLLYFSEKCQLIFLYKTRLNGYITLSHPLPELQYRNKTLERLPPMGSDKTDQEWHLVVTEGNVLLWCNWDGSSHINISTGFIKFHTHVWEYINTFYNPLNMCFHEACD